MTDNRENIFEAMSEDILNSELSEQEKIKC